MTLHPPFKRHPRVRLAAAMLGALALIASAAPLVAFGAPLDGVVTGQVSNGTAGGTSPDGDTATLLIFGVKEQAQVGERGTRVAADGTYRFEGLDRDPNLAYFVLVEHQGVSYPHPQPFQLKDQPSLQADVTVYDTTSSDEQLRFERLNVLVADVSPGLLTVMQMGTLVNAGDRTFVPTDPQMGVFARGFKFGLPAGALNAQMQSGFGANDVAASTDGIQVIRPLRPGRQQFALAFQLPYTGTAVDLGFMVHYPTAALSVYAPSTGAQLQAAQLQAQGSATLGGQSYALFTTADLGRRTGVSARLTNLPSVGGSGLSPTQLALVGLGASLFVLAAGTLLFSLRRGRARPDEAGGVESAEDALERERMQLIIRMAALDDRFAAGEVDEHEYEAERQRGTQRLVQLTRLRRESGSAA